MQKNLLFSQLCAYMVTSEQYLAEILGSLYLLVGFSMILLSNIHFLYVGAQYAFKILLQFLTLSLWNLLFYNIGADYFSYFGSIFKILFREERSAAPLVTILKYLFQESQADTAPREF